MSATQPVEGWKAIEQALQEIIEVMEGAYRRAPSRTKPVTKWQSTAERWAVRGVAKLLQADGASYDIARHTDSEGYGKRSTRVWVAVVIALKWCRVKNITRNIGWVEEIGWIRIIGWRESRKLSREATPEELITYFSEVWKEAITTAGVRRLDEEVSKTGIAIMIGIAKVALDYTTAIIKVMEWEKEGEATVGHIAKKARTIRARKRYAEEVYKRMISIA